MSRQNKQSQNRFVTEQVKKVCLTSPNLECVEALFAINEEKPTQEIYLELIDEMVKRDDLTQAINAAKKAGKRGRYRLIHLGYV